MIWEDPDELGYYVAHEKPKQRAAPRVPFHGIDMTAQDFKDIEAAATHARAGDHRSAEKCRQYAGYGGLGPERPVR